jgi:formate-dependent nitrite reductase membrane component NrfD
MTTPEIYFQAEIARWGWIIAWFLWFSGIAGMSSVAYYFVRRAPMAFLIFGTLVISLVLVASTLTRWWNLPAALFNALINWTFNWHSWMMIGIAILMLHLVLSLFLAVGHLRLGEMRWLRWTRALQQSRVFLGVLAANGLVITFYTGFLLTQAVGVPLWNSALIPILFVISSAVAAIAVLKLFNLLGWVDDQISVFGQRVSIGLDAVKLLAILAFLHVSLTVGSAGARIGALEMAYGQYALMTWLGVVGVGIIIPLAIGVYVFVKGKSKPLLLVSAVAALAGVFFLRAVVLLAGVFEPLAL